MAPTTRRSAAANNELAIGPANVTQSAARAGSRARTASRGRGSAAAANPPAPPAPVIPEEDVAESVAPVQEVESRHRVADSLRSAGSMTVREAIANAEEAERLAAANQALEAELARYRAGLTPPVAPIADHVDVRVGSVAARVSHGRTVLPPPPPPPTYMAPMYAPPLQQGFQGGPNYWVLIKQMRDMGTETFSGGSDPIAADNWRRKLEHNLEHIRCPAEYRRDLATQYLRDDALFWWQGKVADASGGRELTYEDFRNQFARKYFPPEAMDAMENKFMDLRQGKMTVREYEQEFNRLRRFVTRDLTQSELIRRFLNGLEVGVQSRCRIRTYDFLEELVEKASEQEAGIAKERRAYAPSSVKADNRKREHGQAVAEQRVRCATCNFVHDGSCRKCFSCGQIGHMSNRCPSRGTRPRSEVVCYACNEKGHFANECPKRQLPPPPKSGTPQRLNAITDYGGVEPITG